MLLLFRSKYRQFFLNYKDAFQKKKGLEIGGPSKFFSTDIFPIYQWAETIDGCNFGSSTLWEGEIKQKEYSYYPKKVGKQFILDGTNLFEIADKSYDFLLSCHNLEHIANPLLALKEWLRVLKKDGLIILILPDKRFTFDRRRAYTNIEHILSDFALNIKEDDLTHLPEILELHDLSLDPLAGKNLDAFKKRSENNLNFRALHHHVFSHQLLEEMFTHFEVITIGKFFVPPFHQIIIGKKGS